MARTTFSLDFSDLSLTEIPFVFGGESFILKEATGEIATRFQNERTNRVTYSTDGKVSGVRNIADLGPMLVCWCSSFADGRAVTMDTVNKWPARMVAELFEKAKEISYLDDEKPVGRKVLEALDLPGSPISRDSFVSYIETLPHNEYGDVRRLFAGGRTAKES